MADFSPPSGPPPPKVPEGWVARWNAQYSEWFYVNTYTKQSQWDKPTEPAVDPSQAAPDGAPPGYSAGSTPAPTDSKNPFVNDATRPGGPAGVESDEALARRLQEEENARGGGSSGGYGAPGYGAAAGAGASASYLASTPSHGQPQYPDNSLPVRPDMRSGSSADKAKGILGKLLGSSKNKYGSSGGHGSYGQQNSYYGGPPPGQYGYGGQPQYGQPQYGQPQYGGGHSSGGGLGALGGLLGRGGHGGHGGHGGGFGGHGGYGGGYGHAKPKKSGAGMGMMGGAALGLGAGALVGGAIVADQIHDEHEEQEAYQEGYQDGGGDNDYGGGGDFGGGDFGGD